VKKVPEIKKIEGIVISETNYSESSKILNVLTKDLGIIGIMSKGCRKVKSNLRSVSTKLIYGDFNIYYKENGISTLISVDLKRYFKNIMTDIIKISYATYLIELTSQTYKQNPSIEIYDLFIEGLNKIEDGLDPLVITNIIELKYLDYLGIGINVDGCNICGNQTEIVTLSGKSGGFICKDCYTSEKIISEKAIKVIRMLYYVDISKITKLDLSNQTIKEISEFLDEYYDLYSGLYLKSKTFLKTFSE
jgi:DNA repair protein RecO (recombination protein O)